MITPATYGQWACVVGAAEGLGAAFAEGLARRGLNLILIDIKDEQLRQTAAAVREKYKVEVQILHLDLAQDSSVGLISEALEKYDCRFLVVNAAYGPVKPFLSNSDEELDLYLSVNNRQPLKIIHRYVGSASSGNKGLILISSLAGFRGTQLVVPYAATKAFLWNLAEGLYYEFKGKGLTVSVCCPGSTDTPGFRATGAGETFFTPAPMSPGAVAEEALRKFGKRLFIIPGASNRFAHFLLNRILPRSIASGIHNGAMRTMYKPR